MKRRWYRLSFHTQAQAVLVHYNLSEVIRISFRQHRVPRICSSIKLALTTLSDKHTCVRTQTGKRFDKRTHKCEKHSMGSIQEVSASKLQVGEERADNSFTSPIDLMGWVGWRRRARRINAGHLSWLVTITEMTAWKPVTWPVRFSLSRIFVGKNTNEICLTSQLFFIDRNGGVC